MIHNSEDDGSRLAVRIYGVRIRTFLLLPNNVYENKIKLMNTSPEIEHCGRAN